MPLENRAGVCCFTGHRPEKLHGDEQEIKTGLESAILRAIDSGYDCFISGMSRGVDIWAAEIVLELKRDIPELQLIAALPYEGMGNSWNAVWKDRYLAILDKADRVKVFSSTYHRGVYFERDKWMVDMCSRVIAVYHGEPGGTKSTIDYAGFQGVEVVAV